MVPCCPEDDPLLLRGWSPAAQRMVPCCSEDAWSPCCSEDGPLLLRGWSPAAQRVIPCCPEDDPLLLRGRSPGWSPIIKCDNAAVRCSGALYTDCSRDIKDGAWLTHEEEKQAAGLLKRVISTSPDKAIIQLATGEAVI